jgi:hypothetical protein
MKKISLLMLSATIAFAACEKTIIVPIPEKDPKLVVHALLEKGDPIVVTVGRSRHILKVPGYQSSGWQDAYTVKNAVPIVYENGIAIDTLQYDIPTYTYKSPRNKTILDGKVYTIKVTAPGFVEAEATTVVPSQSVIASVTRVRDARTNSSGNTMDEVTIRLDDPAEKNFYLVQVFSAGYSSNPGYYIYCINTSDKDVEAIGYSDPTDPENCFDGDNILMRDDNFNGRQKQLKLFIDSDNLRENLGPNGEVYRPYIKVKRITEDQFKYILSYDAYESGSDNPFAEPANVFSNVRNGFGIFTAQTMAVDTLR